MASIALFHSVLGVRPGVQDAAERLRAGGHEVLVVDQYDGRSFDDYDTAIAYQEEVGFPALLQSALDATADLPDGFVVAGFSNGAGMAEHVALHRAVAAAVLFSGALPLPFLGADSWPAAVPVQLHYAVSDPKRNQDWVDQLLAAVRASGAPAELHEYEASGHLFTDASLPEEYDAQATEALWGHVHDFLRDVPRAAHGATSPRR